MRIYCPICFYEPVPQDHWVCSPGCGQIWNTFLTHGQCPNCFAVWTETCCPGCKLWSRHQDWYHDGVPLQELKEQEVERV